MPHTPGPWTVEYGDGFYIPEICGHIDDHNENYRSDAALVCAATDMLEALRIAHDTMKLWDGIAERHGLGTKSLSMAIEKAQQAIAKATGEDT